MLKSSRSLIDAVVVIASNSKRFPVSSKVLANRQGLPVRYLEASLQRLVRAGVLSSTRGPRGGYALARSGVTAEEIIRAASNPASDEMPAVSAPVGAVLSRAEQAFAAVLREVTIEDLLLALTEDNLGKS